MANSAWWPAIYNERTAREAAHIGGGGLAIAIALTTPFTLLSTALHVETFQTSTIALINVAVFTPLAWGIWKGSRACTIAALVLLLSGAVYGFADHPASISLVAGFVLLMLIHGVRGTFALQRFMEEKKQVRAASAGADS